MTEIQGDVPTDAFDRLARLASTVLQMSISYVMLRVDDRYVIVSATGLPEPWRSHQGLDVLQALCPPTELAGPLLVSDVRVDPLHGKNGAFEELGIIAYGAMSTPEVDRNVVGWLCVADREPRVWTEQESALLIDLASSMRTEIELFLLKRQIAARTREVGTIVEAIADAVVIYDAQGYKIHENEAARVLFALDAEEGYNSRPIQERVSRLSVSDAEGRLLPLDEFPALRVVRGEVLSGSDAVDLRLLSLENRPLEVNVSGAPIRDMDGNIIGAVIVYREVAARRARERVLAAEQQRLRQVLDVLPEAAVIVDANGDVLASNAAAHAILGPVIVAHDIPGVGASVFAAYNARHSDGTPMEPATAPMVRVLKKGEAVTGARLLVRGADGRDVPLLVNCAPLYSEDAVIDGAVMIFQDVTSLVDLDRTREEFLSSVSHDLKTPLTTIRGYAQLARRRLRRLEGVDVEPMTEAITGIETSATRMLALVNDLLEVTRSQPGTTSAPDLQPRDLVALTHHVIDAIHVPDAHQIVFTRPAALIVPVDGDRITRVVENLLSNALKYSPEGGVVTVSVAREERDGMGWAVLSVHDEGLGIPAADLPRLFERFHRGANVVGRIEGTGVGLASARQIVDIHSGTIEVQSTEGVDSTFTVRLPLDQGAVPRA